MQTCHLSLHSASVPHNAVFGLPSWPKADPALVKSDTITIAVQVNGKRRGEITIAAEADEASVKEAAMKDEGVLRSLEGKAPKRVIVVPRRIVNIVA